MKDTQVEKIEYQGRLLAIVVRGMYHEEGVNFFTDDSNSLQIGMLVKEEGFISKPHIHPPLNKNVESVMETVTVLEGKIKIKFYAEEVRVVQEVVLEQHDSALFVFGGHGYEVIEKCKIFTVKQGPYPGPNLAKEYLN